MEPAESYNRVMTAAIHDRVPLSAAIDASGHLFVRRASVPQCPRGGILRVHTLMSTS